MTHKLAIASARPQETDKDILLHFSNEIDSTLSKLFIEVTPPLKEFLDQYKTAFQNAELAKRESPSNAALACSHFKEMEERYTRLIRSIDAIREESIEAEKQFHIPLDVAVTQSFGEFFTKWHKARIDHALADEKIYSDRKEIDAQYATQTLEMAKYQTQVKIAYESLQKDMNYYLAKFEINSLSDEIKNNIFDCSNQVINFNWHITLVELGFCQDNAYLKKDTQEADDDLVLALATSFPELVNTIAEYDAQFSDSSLLPENEKQSLRQVFLALCNMEFEKRGIHRSNPAYQELFEKHDAILKKSVLKMPSVRTPMEHHETSPLDTKTILVFPKPIKKQDAKAHGDDRKKSQPSKKKIVKRSENYEALKVRKNPKGLTIQQMADKQCSNTRSLNTLFSPQKTSPAKGNGIKSPVSHECNRILKPIPLNCQNSRSYPAGKKMGAV